MSDSSKPRNDASTREQSAANPAEASSDIVLVATTPSTPPPRVVDYDELDKKAVDILVDSLKYIATTSGIVIAMYSQAVREYVKDPAVVVNRAAQSFVFSPLVLWFITIVATVIAIYPRHYHAFTDAEKEAVVLALRTTKQRWLIAALTPFLVGFALFLYIIGAQIWRIYPFG
jgi:hypothetical protein